LDDEDDLLTGLIAVARDHLERTTGLALISREMRLYLDGWPQAGMIEFNRGPVQAIGEIRVYADQGVETVVDLGGHVLDGTARPARLWLRNPPAPGQTLNGVEIDFTAGFGQAATEVPDTLKRAMLIHIARMYEFRGAVPVEMQPAGVPEGYEQLLAPFVIRRL
jgi:uncharacterized phiE125 gp8 family phage protein